MATGVPRIPRKDGDFDPYLKDTTAYWLALSGGATNWSRLGLSGAEITAWVNYNTAWGVIYPQFTNLNSRTKTITKDKNDVKAAFIVFASPILTRVKVNPLLTNADRSALNLPKADTEPSPSPIPDTTPVVTPKGGFGSQVIVYFKQFPTEPGTDSRAKPKGVARMEMAMKLGGNAPLSIDECNRFDTSTRSPKTLIFNTGDSGKRVFMFCRWVNTSNQPGPWLEEAVSTIIP
jgi:hypothetical protein